jgi:glycosyltransferase involved in cell wall biosynthesis
VTRTLVADQEPPQASRDGGAARMVTLLRLLKEVGHSVAFASLRPWPVDLINTEERLAQLGVEIAARDGAIGSWLRAHGRELDLVVASRLPVAEVMLPLVRRHCPNARFVYDATHVEHLARYRLAKLTGSQQLLATALRDRSAEREVVVAADAIIATSDEDADELRQLATGADIHVVPAVDARGDRDDVATSTRAGIVFLGFLGVVENEIAVQRLIERVWPLVEAELGPTSLTVVGAAPPEWLLTRSETHPRLIVTGHVPVIDEVLRQAAVTVIPLSGGAGVKTKVLQAFAKRLPVVATAAGMRGVPAVDGVHALFAESDDELASAAVRILRDPDLGRSLASRASTLLRERFTDDVYRVVLQKVLAVRKRVYGG